MKKTVLLLGLLLFTQTGSFANCDYDYKCVEPYDLNSSVGTFFSRVTGTNFATEKTAEILLKKEIKKILNSDDLKLDISSYSSKDLKKGIFKSAHVQGKNVNINDIYISSIDLKTLCNFNYIEEKGKDIIFKEDLPLDFDLGISASDLNKTMNTSAYKKIINDVNGVIEKFGGVQVSSTKIHIKSNKIYYSIGISFPFVKKEQTIDITSDLGVKDGKIRFKDAKFTSSILKMDLKKMNFLLKYLNPLDFSVEVLDNKSAQVNVKSVEIKDNIIKAKGIVVINKD